MQSTTARSGSRRFFAACFGLLLVVALMLRVPHLSAQSLAGLAAISGTVRDPSGAPVGEAVVTVANHNIGVERKLVTNNEGYFIASSLPPSPDYAVSVKKPGFAIYETKIEVLQVGQNITMTAVLTIAQQAETVTVTAETPLVEQARSGIAQEVGNAQILNLPINGRRVDQFALLTPGATTDG